MDTNIIDDATHVHTGNYKIDRLMQYSSQCIFEAPHNRQVVGLVAHFGASITRLEATSEIRSKGTQDGKSGDDSRDNTESICE